RFSGNGGGNFQTQEAQAQSLGSLPEAFGNVPAEVVTSTPKVRDSGKLETLDFNTCNENIGILETYKSQFNPVPSAEDVKVYKAFLVEQRKGKVKGLVITPIAPHNLNARPLVIPDDTEIKLKVSGREEQYLVSLDSRIATLDNNSILTIKKTPFQINMVEIPDETFLNTLRNKLLWGEDKRN
ncbi:MAG: hypothetical protein WCJ62_06745, partial [Flavobacterium sp.]